jgi:hypothetical protein
MHIYDNTRCKQKSDKRKQPCPYLVSSPTPSPEPAPLLEPTSKPATCECPLVNCLQGPGFCSCINTAAQNCHQRCGGEPPNLQPCEGDQDYPKTDNEATCECESVFCIQSFPEGCYCANAAAQSCYEKCGGVAPHLKVCSMP